MKNFKFLKNSKLYNLQSLSFSAKLFAQENIKTQKIFKFTKNKNDEVILKTNEKLLSHMTRISSIKEQIKKADYEIYNTIPKDLNAKNVKYLKKEEDDGKLNPINYEAKRKKSSLTSELKDLCNEVEKFKDSLGLREKSNISPKLKEKKEQVAQYSLIKNVFSHQYRFSNKFLNEEFINSLTRSEDSKPWDIRKDEQAIEEKRKALEGEVADYITEKLNKEFEKENIETLNVPKVIASKPFVRTSPSNENQASFLLVENDINCVYDIDIEYERLLKVTSKRDDFGFKVKEEDDSQTEEKDLDEREVEEPPKNCLNKGKQGSQLKIDGMIRNLI